MHTHTHARTRSYIHSHTMKMGEKEKKTLRDEPSTQVTHMRIIYHLQTYTHHEPMLNRNPNTKYIGEEMK